MEKKLVTRKTKAIKENIVGYIFILPTLIGFLLFMIYPILYSLFLSFMDWNMFKGLSGSTFVGLENFKEVFQNEYFIAGITNNIKLTFMAVPIMIVLALVIAVLLNQKIFARGALRVMYFMPYIATVTAAAVVFSALFHAEYGPVNGILRSIGITNPPGWHSTIKYALPTIALFWIWKYIGYCIVIFLAGLQGISKSYYEAASIDGASPFKQFLYITVPLVSPTTFFLIVTSVIQSFQVFAEVKVMTDGGPGTATITTVYHIYKEAFVKFDMGYASAVSWVFFLIIVGITAAQWIGQKKWVKY